MSCKMLHICEILILLHILLNPDMTKMDIYILLNPIRIDLETIPGNLLGHVMSY